ncbi:MAG: hypothetical protein ABI216_08065 [Devosia sp.]
MKSVKHVGGPNRARRRKGYWSSKSDAELLALDFYSEDPSKLPRLLEMEPQTDESPEVEFSYDTTQTGTGMVMCVHCKKSAPNHNRGFVMQFQNGDRILIGKDCGRKLYGESFSHAERDHREAAERGSLLRKRLGVLGAKLRLVELLETVEGNPCWLAYGELRRDFNNAMPDLAHELADAVRSRDGALYANTLIHDVEAEAAYENRTGRKAPHMKTVSVVHSVLAGRSFFKMGEASPDRLVPDYVHRAKAALWTLEETDKSNHDFRLFFTALNLVISNLQSEAERIDVLPVAFGMENGKRISEWAAANRLPSFHAELARWYIGNRDGVTTVRSEARGWVSSEIHLPSAWPLAPHAELREIAAILSK